MRQEIVQGSQPNHFYYSGYKHTKRNKLIPIYYFNLTLLLLVSACHLVMGNKIRLVPYSRFRTEQVLKILPMKRQSKFNGINNFDNKHLAFAMVSLSSLSLLVLGGSGW